MKVQADVFPAKVIIAPPNSLTPETIATFYIGAPARPEGTRTLDRCRIVVVNDQILIGVDAPEGTNLVFQEKIQSFQKIEKRFLVTTVTGKTLSFQKDDNCGCGSRLRSWSPYGSILMAQSEED